MKCPHCNVNLVMSEKQGVEIDYCPECRGIWLDKGELDKIIERSLSVHTKENDRNPYPKEHHSDKSYAKDIHYDNHDNQQHKKKSFLQDIFDFG